MAKSLTQNGVTFSNYKNSNDGIMPLAAGILVSGAEGVDPEFGGIVNAVDIDWNGARLHNNGKIESIFNPYAPNAIINTTGEFCSKRCS